jgi:hypothetical protein
MLTGPGVGKGRQIAGMIAENHFRKVNNRNRAVWISVSADLIWDARRDLRDLGLHGEILCHDLKVCHLPSTLPSCFEFHSISLTALRVAVSCPLPICQQLKPFDCAARRLCL